ncbi:MAG TPA: hypothetical protein VF751_00915 [Chthoniobacterales bacterium]
MQRLVDEYQRAAEHVEEVPAWILPPRSCGFLEKVAALLPAGSTAFEFGSGRSTHSLRRAFAGAASIEDSADYLGRTEALENSVPKRDSDFSGVVPLTRCWNRLRPIESFNVLAQRESLQRLQKAKLILVDSPPNPAKREHALFLAMDQAPAGAVIVLDDLEVGATSRFAHRLARQNADRFRFWLLEIDHKLGVFLKLRAGRMRSRPSFREFVGAWLRS